MRSQFHVLFRQFLFRIVDEAVLSPSAGGDASKLLSQYAGILFYVSLLAAGVGVMMAGHQFPAGAGAATAKAFAHFFISTTVLVAGLFAVFSWDACYPDHRDVLVLMPLPVSPRTIVLAKVCAVAASLALMVGALHCAAGLVWPAVLALAASPGATPVEIARTYLAYFLAIAGSALLVFATLLCVQGAPSLLPRLLALRLSPLLQIGAFSVLLLGYFMEGRALAVEWSPTYWFLGVYEVVAGSDVAASHSLAKRALIALGAAVGGAALCFAVSYLRTMRMILEQPGLAPRTRCRWALPRFRPQQVNALAQFQLRLLARSRQHRFVVALFLGLAFSIVVLFVKTPAVQGDLGPVSLWTRPNAPLLVASIVMLFLAIAGCRVAFSMPADLKANWIFQLLPGENRPNYSAATRRTLWLAAVAPTLLLWGVVLAWLWPWRYAAGHLVMLCALAAVLIEGALFGFHKIPFTCSYLPGRANVYYSFFAFTVLGLDALLVAARGELAALRHPSATALTAAALVAIAAAIHRHNESTARTTTVCFDEISPPSVTELSLSVDRAL